MSRRYYIMGVVGVGKSTLREQLRSHLQSASIYKEWPEEMAAEVRHAMQSLSRDNAEEVQEWIFAQLARKNSLIANDRADLLIVDRCPLGTFAIYPPQEWQPRAQQMLDALQGAVPVASPLVAGELIFLHGSPRAIHGRMDKSRGYSVNGIAQQQSAFELIADLLAANFDYRVHRIDTRERTPEEVVQQALGIIDARGSGHYEPLNIQSVVEALAGGQG